MVLVGRGIPLSASLSPLGGEEGAARQGTGRPPEQAAGDGQADGGGGIWTLVISTWKSRDDGTIWPFKIGTLW